MLLNGDQKMRILHVLDHSLPLHSGYSFRTKNIMKGQLELGYTVAGLTSDKQGTSRHEVETVEDLIFYRTNVWNKYLKSLPVMNQLETVYGLKKRLENLVKTFKPDILHAHSPSLTALAAKWVARKHHIPLVYEVRAFWEDAAVDHGTHTNKSLRYRITRQIDTYLFHRMDSVVTICEGLKQDIIERGVDPDRITVIPNAIDSRPFKPDEEKANELRKALKLENQIVLGFMGSFYQYEGLIFLLEAMKACIKRFSNIKLILAGGGPEESNIQQQIKALKLENDVILLGRVDHGEISTLYRLFDVCVYPRHKIRLTDIVTPLKPLEAMAHSCLVLASDVGGHVELIDDEVTGILFKAGSKEDLIKRLEFIFSHPERRNTIIHNALKFVKEKRSWQINIKKYQTLYEALSA